MPAGRRVTDGPPHHRPRPRRPRRPRPHRLIRPVPRTRHRTRRPPLETPTRGRPRRPPTTAPLPPDRTDRRNPARLARMEGRMIAAILFAAVIIPAFVLLVRVAWASL